MINDIIIDFFILQKFCKHVGYKIKCNPIIDLSKFTPNEKILGRDVALGYNQVCSKILS